MVVKGYLSRRINIPQRVNSTAITGLVIYPGTPTDVVGYVLLVLLVATGLIAVRKRKTLPASGENHHKPTAGEVA